MTASNGSELSIASIFGGGRAVVGSLGLIG